MYEGRYCIWHTVRLGETLSDIHSSCREHLDDYEMSTWSNGECESWCSCKLCCLKIWRAFKHAKTIVVTFSGDGNDQNMSLPDDVWTFFFRLPPKLNFEMDVSIPIANYHGIIGSVNNLLPASFSISGLVYALVGTSHVSQHSKWR